MSDWTDEKVEILTRCWRFKEPASRIAERIGLSKNAVIGKARRLGLDGRLSPIKRGGPTKPKGPARLDPGTPKPTTPRSRKQADPPAADRKPPRPPEPAPDVPDDATVNAAAIFALTASSCRWPLGYPGKPGFHFCCARAERGSYCHEHAALAFRRVGDAA